MRFYRTHWDGFAVIGCRWCFDPYMDGFFSVGLIVGPTEFGVRWPVDLPAREDADG